MQAPHAIETTPEFVSVIYGRMSKNLDIIRGRLGRALTFAEKVLLSHLADPAGQALESGKSYLLLKPDRVAMQDATAQMALLQFMLAGRATTAVPTTVHCDHLIVARKGALLDTREAAVENREVYDFLHSVSARYGIGFWGPGAGIIHQVVLENYAFPGGMMIGTDSHTPNAGGLGMWASGVGGADAVDVMAGFPWEVLYPKIVGVRLTGALDGWSAPKDVILKLLAILTTAGGTNRVIEFFGPGVASISCTGKATITNMGAELGATCSLFPYDARMGAYLRGTGRAALADLADAHADLLRADAAVEADPERFYEKVIEIDLSTLAPHIVGPHTPDLARPVSQLGADAKANGYPLKVSSALIGSCTNSSYEDLSRAADVAEQARAHGAKMVMPLLISPGSNQIQRTIERDGQMATFDSVGATVLSNACGPCIGQWKRDEMPMGEANSIVTSFNRNFKARNDSNPGTFAFISSPEIVMAIGLSGRLDFDPATDELVAPDGHTWKLRPPAPAPELPPGGFVHTAEGYAAPAADGASVTVQVAEASKRLQLLAPFSAWDGNDYQRLPLLVKAKGKCTTDHISPAGKWLTFRGHLDNISDNMFIGAVNAFTGDAGKTKSQLDGATAEIPKVARAYKAAGLRWVVVGDSNYGEGSSREHAAMSPRHLGAAAIIVRSFARIHESNLKKQGVLPLTFADAADYDKVREDDRVSLTGLAGLAPGKPIAATLHHSDGTEEHFLLNHTLNDEQIGWFKAGSALNLLARKPM